MKSPIGQYYTTMHKAHFTDNFMRLKSLKILADAGSVFDFSAWKSPVGRWELLDFLPGAVTSTLATNILVFDKALGNTNIVDFAFTGHIEDIEGESPFLIEKYSKDGVTYNSQKVCTCTLEGGTTRGDLMFVVLNLHTEPGNDVANDLYGIEPFGYWTGIIFTDNDFNVLPFTKLDPMATGTMCPFIVGVPNGTGAFRLHHGGTGPGYQGTLEV